MREKTLAEGHGTGRFLQILGFGVEINCGLNLNEQKAASSRPFRYHLELQLLMDDLKQARAERRVSKA